jgi:hypothetical protein
MNYFTLARSWVLFRREYPAIPCARALARSDATLSPASDLAGAVLAGAVLAGAVLAGAVLAGAVRRTVVGRLSASWCGAADGLAPVDRAVDVAGTDDGADESDDARLVEAPDFTVSSLALVVCTFALAVCT